MTKVHTSVNVKLNCHLGLTLSLIEVSSTSVTENLLKFSSGQTLRAPVVHQLTQQKDEMYVKIYWKNIFAQLSLISSIKFLQEMLTDKQKLNN